MCIIIRPFTALFILLVLTSALTALEYRTFDGTNNNLTNPTWGAAGTPLARQGTAAYADSMASPTGATRPNPRVISDAIVAQSTLRSNARGISDWVFQWGQLIDHDLDLTVSADPAEPFPVPIPMGDPIFDSTSTGTATMRFSRSKYDPVSGGDPAHPRQQVNEITSYIDASMVYGSDTSRATALRTLTGGRLKTSTDDMMPMNTMNLPNGTGGHPDPTQFFAAGDVRANEQVGLTAAHTLLVREHNRSADELITAHPDWTDEQIYQRARKLVGAEVQVITYNEFLPALMGPYAPSPNGSYDANVNASVLNEFSTAFFRVGHTMLSPQLLRIQNDGTPAPGGPIALEDAFFLPHNMPTAADFEYLLKGLATQQQQEIDNQIVDAVRNFLFGEPMPGAGFDLAVLNIQRGRDHGLADYNSLRVAFGLSPVTDFAEISSNPVVQASLQSLYGNVNDIDPWVGALAEDHLPGSSLGALLDTALAEQFERVQHGDRFWYQNDPDFSSAEIERLSQTRLSDVIRRNTTITNLQDNVFFAVPEPSGLATVLLGAFACVFVVRASLS